jgi:hypothetical protein
MTENEILALDYLRPRRLANGEWIAIARFVFTFGLVVDIRDDGTYRTRFCYAGWDQVLEALLQWDGVGDPPGPWIREKGGVERTNPRVGEFGGVKIVTE